MKKKLHHSTSLNVISAKKAVSVRKGITVNSNSCDTVWIEMDDDSQISHLRQILMSLDDSISLPKTQEPKLSSQSDLSQPSQTKITNVTTNPKINVQEVSVNKQYVTHEKLSVGQRFAGRLFQGSVRSEKMTSFDSLVEDNIKSTTTDQYFGDTGVVLNFIILLDTCSQLEYTHLLPIININSMINFVVHDLSKSLEDTVLVEQEKHFFEPHHFNYSNFDMIRFLMSSINDSLERTQSRVPQLVTIPGNDKKSYLCYVGTHSDNVNLNTILNIDSQLTSMVEKLDCKAAVWQNKDGGVLFPVDNTTAGDDTKEDPIANFIRTNIDKIAVNKPIYELPIIWMLFELEIHQVCSYYGKAYISFEECCSIAYQTNLISGIDEVRSALIFYHLLGVLLFYSDVPGLCNYVIVDHQWLFDKISSVICCAFKSPSNLVAYNSLKYHGVLTKELIQELDWKEELNVEYLIALLVEMKIAAPLNRMEGEGEAYFIPYLLPTFSIKEQCSDFLSQYGYLQGEPLLVQVSNLLPRGFFCCLVVQILQQLPEHLSLILIQKSADAYHTFSNLITFRLHNAYCLSLMDKISFLEVQIRHQHYYYYHQCSIHMEVQSLLATAFETVCEQFDYNCGRLQYGFHCQCGQYDGEHIATLTRLTPPFDYAMCRYGSFISTKLENEHKIWLTEVCNFDMCTL